MFPNVRIAAAVGAQTVDGVPAWPLGLYSQSVKKNNLFFRIGPPMLPPKRLLSKRGLLYGPGAWARAVCESSAFKLRFWKYS